MSDWFIVDLFDNYEFSVPGLFLCSIKGLFQFFSFTRVLRTNINFIIDFPLKTGHKLNVHNYFARRSGRLLNVLFASIYLLRPGVNPVDTGRKLNVHKTFWRRSGHLPNVLYTFNVRLESTGKLYVDNYAVQFFCNPFCVNIPI